MGLCDEIAALAAHISAATARWLKLLGRLDEEEGWDEGYKTLAHWLSWRCGMTLSMARDHVRVAQGLRNRPLIQEAFERGEVSYSKVRALMRLEPDFDEELMLMYARHSSASQIETIVRGCRRCVAVEAGAQRQYAERTFGWTYDDDGTVVFSGRLPAELGALVVRAVEAARDELGPPPPELGEGEPWDLAEATNSAGARRADAFVAVARSALAEKVSSADVYQVIVHVDAEALASASDGSRCHLDDGEPLSHEVIRRLTCDASIVTAIERDGATVNLGRKRRTISPALKRCLHMRDKGCAFPGCSQRHHPDAHHIVHWADGGKTDVDNCIQLCRYHHTLVHRGLFSVRHEHGRFNWYRANGSRLPHAPRQPRGDCARVLPITPAGARAGARAAWSLYPPEAQPGVDLSWSVTAMLETRAARLE